MLQVNYNSVEIIGSYRLLTGYRNFFSENTGKNDWILINASAFCKSLWIRVATISYIGS